MLQTFFIIGCPRTATTAYAKILNIATNAKVFIEQSPKLGYASRELYLGHVDDPKSFIYAAKQEHIELIHGLGKHYGDKNKNYLPFLPYMLEVWPTSKYIFLYKDGRDVVRSIMNFRLNPDRGNVFGMREDLKNSKIIYPMQDLWDYARIRPKEGECYYEEWQELSAFEKICWYWAKYNSLAIDTLSKLDKERYLAINVSQKSIDDVRNAFSFLELSDFNKEKILNMLNAKINTSLKSSSFTPFPKWQNWTSEQKLIFDNHCSTIMAKLGYYQK